MPIIPVGRLRHEYHKVKDSLSSTAKPSQEKAGSGERKLFPLKLRKKSDPDRYVS